MIDYIESDAMSNEQIKCCVQRESLRKLVESLTEEIARMKINLRKLQDRLDGREQARIERMIPQPGESLD